MLRRAAIAAATLMSIVAVAPLHAAEELNEFPARGSTVGGIATDHDGNLWFTEPATNRIARITSAGTIDVFTMASGRSPGRITAGADQDMWFTEAGAIGRITPNGVITHFPMPFTGFGASPVSITLGPDGNIWYTLDISRVGRLTPRGDFQEYETHYSGLAGITAGPDGNLWFVTSAAGESKICRITPTGVLAQFGRYGELDGPEQIITGPDGNLWFTQSTSLGRITPQGTITQYAIGTAGSTIVPWNGELWLANGRSILRVTTDGIVLGAVAVPPTSAAITTMTVAPGRVWLLESFGTLGYITEVFGPRHRTVRH